MLQVDERDISYIENGQHGELTVSSIPGERFGFAVTKVTPVNTAKEGRNFFRVEAILENPPASRVRPGMEGVGKILRRRAQARLDLDPQLDRLGATVDMVLASLNCESRCRV